MAKRSTPPTINATQPKESPELTSFFDVPEAYTRGERDTLRPFFSGDWWLNINYVEQIK